MNLKAPNPASASPRTGRPAQNTVRGKDPMIIVASVIATAIVVLAALASSISIRQRFDVSVYTFVLQHRTPALTVLLRQVTRLANTVTIVAVVAYASMLLAARRRWESLTVMVGASAGAAALAAGIKLVTHRARPALGTMLVDAHGYAFPSGHATQSIATYTALAYVVTHTVARRSRRAWRVATWTGAGLAALGIGLSRVYLGAHWATDVLGGWVLAAGWIVVVTTIAHRVAGRRVLTVAAPYRPGEHDGSLHQQGRAR